MSEVRHDLRLDKETYEILVKMQRIDRDSYPVQTARRLIWLTGMQLGLVPEEKYGPAEGTAKGTAEPTAEGPEGSSPNVSSVG